MAYSPEKARIYRQKNRERINAQVKRWRQLHPDYNKAWKARNASRVKDYGMRWRRANMAWLVEYGRRYRKSHPGWNQARCSARNARERGATIFPFNEAEFYRALRGRGFCGYCKIQLPPEKLQVDHIQPLAKGGAHSPENLIQACKTCNVRKQAQWPWQLPVIESLGLLR